MDANTTTPMLPPNETRGPMLLASVLPFFGLALVVYAARIWTRLRPKFALTAADFTITIAMVSSTPSSPQSHPNFIRLSSAGYGQFCS
jgi:hypothetical protein